MPSERAFSSGGTTSTAKRNCLTPKAFEALQLLKSTYRNGHLAADKEAQKHSLSLIDFSETDDDELAGPKWKGKVTRRIIWICLITSAKCGKS